MRIRRGTVGVMGDLIIAGNPVNFPSPWRIVNWLDAGGMRLDKKNYTQRNTRWVRQIIEHATKGDWPQKIVAKIDKADGAIETIRAWNGSQRSAGAHFVVDYDGSVFQTCDLFYDSAYHAGVWNNTSIGIEMKQDGDMSISRDTLGSALMLTDFLTGQFSIQRQFHAPYSVITKRNPETCVGVFGHRDTTEERGRGCPGDQIFLELHLRGYENFDYNKDEDLIAWKKRQAWLGVAQIDGIAGPATSQALAGIKGVNLWSKLAHPPELVS